MGLEFGILGMWLLEVGRGSEEAGVKGLYRLEKHFRNQKIEHRVSFLKNSTQGGMFSAGEAQADVTACSPGPGQAPTWKGVG